MQEVLEAREKLVHVADVSAVVGRADVVDNHVPDGFQAVLLLQEAARKARGDHDRDVLVLGDGAHLVLAEATQSNAVFKCDHRFTRHAMGGLPSRDIRYPDAPCNLQVGFMGQVQHQLAA